MPTVHCTEYVTVIRMLMLIIIECIGIKIAEAFLLTVTEDEERGLAWLVDPLLDSSATIKFFSGTDEAGRNGDLMGMTCNSFAHFSLYDSSETCIC